MDDSRPMELIILHRPLMSSMPPMNSFRMDQRIYHSGNAITESNTCTNGSGGCVCFAFFFFG